MPPIQRNSEDWQALLTYRNSLVQGEHEIHPITLKQAAQRRYGKKRTVTNIDGMFIFMFEVKEEIRQYKTCG